MLKRLEIMVKASCSNCDFKEFHCSRDGTSPCKQWRPESDWFERKVDAAERKYDKDHPEKDEGVGICRSTVYSGDRPYEKIPVRKRSR